MYNKDLNQIEFDVIDNEGVYTMRFSLNGEDQMEIIRAENHCGDPIPFVSPEKREEILESAKQDYLPLAISRIKEVKHFVFGNGNRFAIAINEDYLIFERLRGKAPSVETFMAALLQMETLDLVATNAVMRRKNPYALEVRYGYGISILLREERNSVTKNYPIRARFRISGRDRVQDFEMWIGDFVGILNKIYELGWLKEPAEEEIPLEEPVFEPDGIYLPRQKHFDFKDGKVRFIDAESDDEGTDGEEE